MSAQAISSVPTVTNTTFRGAMGRLASGVVLVTATDERGRAHGMTATAVTSVSADPPQLLICVNAESRTHEIISGAGQFGVSLLADDQQWLSDRCARPGEDKALEAGWIAEDQGSLGSPMVRGCLVHVDCEVSEAMRAATHTVFVARVKHVVEGAGTRPLIHYGGAYCTDAALEPDQTVRTQGSRNGVER